MTTVSELVEKGDIPEERKDNVKKVLHDLGYAASRAVGKAFLKITEKHVTDAGMSIADANAILAEVEPLQDISRKRRLPSSYTDRRRKLPSASGMNLTIMRQQQGVMMYDDVTQKPCLHGMDSPLYMNYRCNAYQVPIKLLHPVFGKFKRLAETVKPTIASLNFVQTVCAQAKYYYASEEKDYQHVMRRVWKDLLVHLGGVSRPAVGATGRSVPDLALAAPHGLVCIAEFKIGLDDKAQPEALRCHEQLWEETWPAVLNESFAATFVIEMMGAGLRVGGAAWGATRSTMRH
ncbi:hypothetical protein WJX79_007069 [Trebouxia sp. C0005]